MRRVCTNFPMEKQPVLSQDVPTKTSQQATPTEEPKPADSLSGTMSEEGK